MSDLHISGLLQSRPRLRIPAANIQPNVRGFVGADDFAGTDGHPSQLDPGYWLLTQRSRQLGWLRLKHEYVQSTPTRIYDRRNYDAIKRTVDVVVSAILLAILVPMFAAIALLIRMDSPGPALFRQARVGLRGRRFMIWKFRTMHNCSALYSRSPRNAQDPRLTRLGWFLRTTSIDELPQLLNVLQGEMSLIGPRPEMPFIAARYRRFERQRLAVLPGMTGLWQISPSRSAPIHQNLQCDLHYIRNRNFILDLAILLRTVFVVVAGNGPD